MPVQAVGFVLAGLSALCNGSFASLRKVEAVQRVSVTDIQFNLYLSLGVFLSSICSIAVIPFTGKDIGLCWQGVLAGMLLAIAGLFSFLAVSHVGVSVAQGEQDSIYGYRRQVGCEENVVHALFKGYGEGLRYWLVLPGEHLVQPGCLAVWSILGFARLVSF